MVRFCYTLSTRKDNCGPVHIHVRLAHVRENDILFVKVCFTLPDYVLDVYKVIRWPRLRCIHSAMYLTTTVSIKLIAVSQTTE